MTATGDGAIWRSQGGNVSVEVGTDRVRVNGHDVEMDGGRLGDVVGDGAGVLRRYIGESVATGQVAGALRIREVWPGIDARLQFRGGRLKLDWLVAAGADLERIRFRYRGGDAALDGAEVVAGDLRLVAPVASQGAAEIAVAYRISADGWVGFETGMYNRALPLDIDPYVVMWAGNYGGTGVDAVRAMAPDSAGAAYLVGYTDSPVTGGKGSTEAFVIKWQASTSQILWATYLSGTMYDAATGVALDSGGNVWVTGYTSSPDFPQTAWQTPHGDHDVFVAKLGTNGALVFSTLLGGSLADRAGGIAVSPSGDLWLAGETKSADFPTIGARQGTFGGTQDAFLMRLDSAGVVRFSTYWGGSGADAARAVALDGNGEVVIAGTTASANFPVSNAAQGALSGAVDAFVARFAGDGSAVRFSTYLGGTSADASLMEAANAVKVDGSGNSWVVGLAGAGFPLLAPAQGVFGGGTTDGFVARHSRAGSLTFSSVYGGDGSDEATAVVVAGDGTVVVGGYTSSTDLPLLEQIQGAAGLTDGFLVRLASTPSTVLWSSYLGGAGFDNVSALGVLGSTLYVAGTTDVRFLVTPSLAGRIDTWLATVSLVTSYGVTLSPSVSGALYAISGTGCESGTWSGTRTFQWNPGVVCTITPAVSTVSGSTRWRFVSWADGSTAASGTFMATPGLSSLPMNFTTDYLLSRATNPSGAGLVNVTPDSGEGWYGAGTSVQMAAVPAPGFAFTSWTGADSAGRLTMNGPSTVTANFVCSYAISSTIASAAVSGGNIGVDITAGAGCGWTVTSNAPWLTVVGSGSRAGSGTVLVSVAANATGPRTGTVILAGYTLTVTQAGDCWVTTDVPGTTAVAAAGGSVAANVSTPVGCAWSVASNAAWITVSGAASRSGPGSVSATVAANTGLARTGTITVGPHTWSISQAVGCSPQTNFTGIPTTIPSGGGTGVVSVTAGGGCGWTVVSNVAWIIVQGNASRTDSGTAMVTVGANNGPARSGTVTVAGSTWTFDQATGCSVAASIPVGTSLAAAGGSASVSVATTAGCAWSVASNADWISVAGAGTRAGAGSVSVNIAANNGLARSGTVTVAGQTWTITQATGCSVALVPESANSVGAAGGTASTAASTATGCSWSVSSNTEWISVSGGGTRSGAGAVLVNVEANNGPARTGSVTVGGQIWTINQASGCTVSAGIGGNASLPAAGGSASVSVTTANGCAWSVASNSDWISVAGAGTRSGPGSVSVNVAANNGPARSGSVTVAGQTWVVDQAIGCSVSTSIGGNTGVPAAGGSAGVSVTTAAGCSWSAYSNAEWISVGGGNGTRSGAGSVSVSVAANSGPPRSGSVTVAGQTWTIDQAIGCSVVPAIATASIPAVGGSASVAVSTAFGCAWSVASNADWISVAGGGSRSGPGAVSVNVAANNGPARSGSVTVAGQTWIVDQAIGCSVVAGISGNTAVAASGGTAGVSVTTAGGCAWSVISGAEWINVSGGNNRSGPGTVSVTVAANNGPARSGAVSVAGQTWTIDQAMGCSVTTGITGNASVAAAGGSASTTVSTAAGCAWSVSSNVEWISVAGGGSRSGPGSVTVNVSANNGLARSGTVNVGGQTWTIDQAIGCSVLTNIAGSTAVAAAGGSPTVSVTTASGCGWAVTSNSEWISVAGGNGGRTGSGTVTATVAVNTGPARSGAVTVAGQVWTLDQAGGCAVGVDGSATGTVPSGGGTATANISTAAGCGWTVASNDSWLTVSGSGSRSGPATLSVAVAANAGTARTGTVTVAGQTWTISQAAGCTVSASLAGVGVVPALGKAYPVTFTATGTGCANWPATADASWIELSPDSGGPGSTKITVTAYPNFGTGARTGKFRANGQTFSITQAGSTEPESTRFIQLVYFGAMGRMPTADEVVVWTGGMARGVPRASVIQTLFNSGEFNMGSRFVAGLYVGLLDRDPEYTGWRFQRQALRDKIVDQTTIVQAFLTTAEYTLHWGNPTPAEFVRLMYKYILLREASDEEVAFQVKALGQAALYDRFVMARNFLNSEEFRVGAGPRLTAFLLYASVLARDGAPDERTFQANALRAGVPVSAMISAYIGTPEFLGLLK